MSSFVAQLLLLLIWGNYVFAGVRDLESESNLELDYFSGDFIPLDTQGEILERLEWPDLIQFSAVNRMWRSRALSNLADRVKRRLFKRKFRKKFFEQSTSLLNNSGLANLMESYFPSISVTGQPISGWLLVASYRAGDYKNIEWLHQLIGLRTANHSNRDLARIAITALTSLGEKKVAAMRHFMADAGYWIESELSIVRIIASSTSDEMIIDHLLEYKRASRTFMSESEWVRKKNGEILFGSIETGYPGIVKYVLKKLNYHPNVDYEALLLFAIQQDNLDALQALIFRLKEDDADTDIHGLLRVACYFASSPALVEYLLEMGADPNGAFNIAPNQSFFEGGSRLAFILRHQLTFERMGLTPLEIVSMHEDETVQRELTTLLERKGAKSAGFGPSSVRKQWFGIGPCRRLASSLFSRSRAGPVPSPTLSATHRLFYSPDGACTLLLSKPSELETDIPFDNALALDDIVSCTVNDFTIDARIAAFSANGDVFLIQDKSSFIFIRKRISAIIETKTARYKPKIHSLNQL